MQIDTPVRAPLGNQLLDRFSDQTCSLLTPHLRRVTLEHSQILYEEWQPVRTVYFPTTGVVSAMIITVDGRAIEVANIGKEGLVGVEAVFGLQPSIHKVIVQIAGEGLRIELSDLERFQASNADLRDTLTRYFTAFRAQVSQSVACNGLHGVKQRCCRWLLMTHDRVEGDELSLTHEFLAIMLGVRRASVSEILKLLEDEGLVRRQRGRIVIVDRVGMATAACECHARDEETYLRLLGQTLGES